MGLAKNSQHRAAVSDSRSKQKTQENSIILIFPCHEVDNLCDDVIHD
jgi:hypothetical protein